MSFLKNKMMALSLLTAMAASANRDGLSGIDHVHSAQSLGKGNLKASIQSHVINDERLLQNGLITNNSKTEWTSYFLIANSHLGLGYGVTDQFDLGLALPIYYEETVNSWGNPRGFASGEVKATAKYRLATESKGNPWALAFLAGAFLPTSQQGKGAIPREFEFIPEKSSVNKNGSHAFGTGKFESFITAALTADLNKLEAPIPLQWHLNTGIRKVGFKLGTDREYDDIFSLNSALEYQAWSAIGFFGEFFHESRFNRIWDKRQFTTEPTTVTLGLTGKAPKGFNVWTGLVFGLMHSKSTPITHINSYGQNVESFGLKGSVPVSIAAGLSWTGSVIDLDKDKDGIPDLLDKCPNDAEDKDGFQDADGCPDLDNDQDGLSDIKDKCPIAAEDLDGFEDEDGCPETDNDKDGVLDLNDKCPNLAQGEDGKEGCPNLDKDNDGIADTMDKCPKEAEDKDGFQDEDGCIDPDNDKDGITDINDKCPNESEIVNGYLDQDGCPDTVIAKGQKLVLKGVYFKLGSTELASESSTTLDGLADQLKTFPEVKLEVQGHTDNKGKAASNKKLSQKRAESVVKYLVDKGIVASRLKAKGYGSDKPVADNATEEGRALNRRVELQRND